MTAARPSLSLLVALALLAGCDTRESRVKAAYDEYQAAAAVGDLRGARNGLLKLVAADENVAEYWIELGKVQVSLGAFQDAYFAYTRALELDRDNPQILNVLTQVAMRSGEFELAEQYAEQLELLAPNDFSVKMTYGLIALRRGDLETAGQRAEQILATQPNSSDAKILQALVLDKSGDLPAAIRLLTAQVEARPSDSASLRVLASFHDRSGNTREAANVRRALWMQDRENPAVAFDYIRALFRAGDTQAARGVSVGMMGPDAPGQILDELLSLWKLYWPGEARLQEARRLASAAGNHQRLAYAAFFNDIGAPRDALPLVAPDAVLPVKTYNIAAHSIMAMALMLDGQRAEAARRIQAVLALDPDNVEALRARVELNLANRRPLDAVNDARKVVALSPKVASDRVLLSRAHQANGDSRAAVRVLWESFRDLPANPQVYTALRQYLARSADTDSLRKLDREYDDQRQAEFTREFA